MNAKKYFTNQELIRRAKNLLVETIYLIVIFQKDVFFVSTK